MNDPALPPARRWVILNWRNARRLLVAGAVLVTLLALFFTYENWRGQQEWKAFQDDLKARGEPRSIDELLPPPPPDSENFAAVPLLKPLLDYRHVPTPDGGSNVWASPEAHQKLMALQIVQRMPRDASADRHLRRRTDFAAWQAAFREDTNSFTPSQPLSPAVTVTNKETGRAEARYDTNQAMAEVLLALKRFNPEMEALHAAINRKHIHFPVHYDEGFAALLPHLQVMRQLARVSQLRAAAALAQSRTTGALREVELIIRMSEAAEREPILISQLVRVAMLSLAVETVWEGLDAKGWNEDQLRTIEQRLRSLDLTRDYLFAMRGERILALRALDLVSKQPETFKAVTGEMPMEALFRFGPSGWYLRNLSRFGRMFDEFALPLVDLEQRRFHLDVARAKAREFSEQLSRFSLHTILAKLLMPAYEQVLLRLAECQVTVDQARIACVLERHRLAHQRLPETLEALRPLMESPLPKDPTNGENYRYEITDEGRRYRLWSPGPDGRDDGGRIEWEKKDSGKRDPKRGDWVWMG
jgi:hypothetical protein